MSVILYMPKPDIPESLGWIHESSDWILGTSPILDDDSIVAESKNDEVNLTSITLDFDPIPGVTYYAKARVNCNKSIFESNVGIVTYADLIDITFKHPIPAFVNTPIITLEESNDSIPTTRFIITSSTLSTPSNTIHKSTSRIIRTLTGEVIWSDLYNRDELNEKEVNDIILEANTVYIISVIYHTDSNDHSELANTVIKTQSSGDIKILSPIGSIDKDTSYILQLDIMDDFDSMDIKLYSINHGNSRYISKVSTDSLTVSINNNYFIDVETLLLQIEVRNDDGIVIGYKNFILNPR